MNRQKLYSEAAASIAQHRKNAEIQQEQRTAHIYREIPEIAEIDARLRSACLQIIQAGGDAQQRAARLKAIERHTIEAQTMLGTLLKSHGYPEDYLDIHYHCSICNDTGFHRGRHCECFRRELGRIGAEALSSQVPLGQYRFENFSLQYYRDLPLEQSDAMRRIYEKCKSYAEAFTPASSSLLMCGNTGLGKTHLSLAIAGVVVQKGYGVIYDSAGSLLRRLEREQFGREQNSDMDTLSLLLDCDLLVLDDFGTEFSTGFTRSAIYTILNGRLTAAKPMIINTNLTPEDIQREYGDRIVSRLFASCTWLEFVGRDIRILKQKVKAAQEGGV